MGIKKYLGPFDKNGNIINRTVVVYECDECGNESTLLYKSAKEKDGLCRTCKQFGAPLLPSDVFDEYPEIVEIHDLSSRGGVVNDTVVSAICSGCDNVYDIPFRNLKKLHRKDMLWRCHPCAQIERYNDSVFYPEDIQDMIISYDESTLGHRGQLKNGTVLTIVCDDCGEEFDRYWNNLSADSNYCSGCTMRHKWDEVDFVKKHQMAMDKANNSATYISGGHKALKEAMIDSGISGFKSERWIGPHRVDEVNYSEKVIIEYYGSYWHADPAIYNGSDIMFKGRTAKEIWDYDYERINKLKDYGYRVIVVWEKDFQDNPERIINELKILIGDKIPILGEYEK